jgi:two-component system sensor histidine kinase/response regulator
MKTILLLDDDASILTTFGMALRHHGYRVIEASSGEEGLQLARKHLPDLILSDISMPGTGGQAVLQSIREHPELSTKQVVLMTGESHLVTPRRGMELGADDFLVKPINLKDLLNCVDARFKRAHVHWRVEDRLLTKLRSTLQSTLPHELFTPLGGIIGLAEVLLSDLSHLSLDEIKELLKDIHSSGVTLHRTLRNYLMILDLEALPTEGVRAVETLSARQTEENLFMGINAALRRNGREWDLKIHLEKSAVMSSPGDLNVIAEELADNACKFSVKGSPINVHFSPEAVLTVTDKGRGMTPEEITQLGLFQQLDRKKFEQQGLGLGLALVQKLAAKNGAQFSIESQPTLGTTAKITFRKAGSN